MKTGALTKPRVAVLQACADKREAPLVVTAKACGVTTGSVKSTLTAKNAHTALSTKANPMEGVAIVKEPVSTSEVSRTVAKERPK